MKECMASSSRGHEDQKTHEDLEYYFPSGGRRRRPMENCGKEYAVRSTCWKESMVEKPCKQPAEENDDGARLDCGRGQGEGQKPREDLEYYFPSGGRRRRPMENCGEEYAVRSSYWKESMADKPCEEEEQGGAPHLECSVWTHLPDELHARILEKVPFAALLGLRRVCKRWNATILSVGFDPSPKCTRKCVPMYFHDDVPSTVFNKKRNSWQQISFSFLETPSSLLSLLVSAGGLLCFKTGIAGELVVCNPITRQSRRLQVPCRIIHDSISLVPVHSEVVIYESAYTSRLKVCRLSTFDKEVVVGMLMDREGRHYKLVVAGVTLTDGSTERSTLVYDSLTNSWKRGGDVPRGMRFWRTGKPVASNGYVYFITYCKHGWMEHHGGLQRDWMAGLDYFDFVRPWGVVRYDVENDRWHFFGLPRRNSILFQLVEHQGRILVVQRRTSDQSQMFTNELKEDGEVLPFETTRMPVELFPDALRRELVLGDWCVGQGDRLYVAGIYPENSWQCSVESGTYRPTQVDKCLGFGVLAHNPSDNSWTQLPDLCGRYYPEGLYAFEPSLANV